MKSSSNRKRKFSGRGKQVNNLVQEVFRTYGCEANEDDSSISGGGTDGPRGRKQRRRDEKLEKKRKKRRNFEQKFVGKKNTSSEIKIKQVEKSGKKDVKKLKLKKQISTEDKKKKTLLKENEKEEKTISSLEKKLFLNKRKGKKKLPKSFVDAGLDYILNVIDGGESKDSADAAESEDDFFSRKPTVQDPKIDTSDEEEMEDICMDDGGEEDDFGSDSEESDQEEEQDALLDVAQSDANDSESLEMGAIENPGKSMEDISSKVKQSIRNDGKYVPPALRVKLSDEAAENKRKLKRKLKGLYNRLSDANLNTICNEIEELYRSNSRAVVNEVLSETLLDTFKCPDPVPETLVMESAMLVSVTSVRVALEFLMYFYEAVTLALHSILVGKGNEFHNGKATNNLIQLLGCLYQLKTIDHRVICDFFHLIVESFMEKDVELILEILNKVGFQLRKDSPESLQEIIKKISVKSSDLKVKSDDGSRMSYMLSILMAVKNNNIRKVTGYDPDAVTAKRRRVTALTKSYSNSDSLPPLTLKDFIDVEISGRWWVVGSSFVGRPMLRNEKNDDPPAEIADEAHLSVSKKVIEAARTQRMNTDVRRKIFYAVMTADDFVDAYEKVAKCGLKGKQLREIPNVIVDCCLQEKRFNLYYVHLLHRFCQHDRQFSISLQCSLWDRFKVLPTLKAKQISHIVQLLTHLTLMEAVPLSCLKAIDFAEIDKTTVDFVRSYLCSLAQLAKDKSQIKTLFDCLVVNPKCKLVRQGLNLFLQHFVLDDQEFMTKNEESRNTFRIMLNSLKKSNKTFL